MRTILFLYRISVAAAMLWVAAVSTAWAQDADLVAVADEQYNFGDKRDANETYQLALTFNADNVRANYMAGICYLETIHKDQALPFLQKAYALDPAVDDDILYLIGQAYHLGERFDEAIDAYERYLAAVRGRTESKRIVREAEALVERRQHECRTGKELKARPEPVEIISAGGGINTIAKENAPAITADESLMIFTSRRAGGMSPDKARDNIFFEDIYYSERNGDTWQPAQLLPGINTETHDASIGLSADGKMLLLYKDDNAGDIFVSYREKDGSWSKPRTISDNINSSFRESAASFSADGQRLYFASDRSGGQGGMDLYMSESLGKRKWGAPVNLGPTINTEYDDDGPVMSFDGTTLYFSSKGHRGMGGFDLFKSAFDETTGQWGDPENLGYPINTPDDDIHYAVGADGQAYYASVKDNLGEGDMDIFLIRPKEPTEEDTVEAVAAAPVDTVAEEEVVEAPVAAPAPLLPVVCHVSVANEAGEPLDAEVFWDEGHFTAASPGQYHLESSDTVARRLRVTVQAPGYVYQSVSFDVPPADTDQRQRIVKAVRLRRAGPGTRVVLRNVYFEFNEARLKKSSYAELDRLEQLLSQTPNLQVEIAGHTDRVGSAQFNKQLSQRRAEAVRAYLTQRGVAADRVRAVGYGEEKPLASNDDEAEGRELNRRTEFIVLGD
ncbi:MAG: OmpA family protein [Catalinimonas sp.]